MEPGARGTGLCWEHAVPNRVVRAERDGGRGGGGEGVFRGPHRVALGWSACPVSISLAGRCLYRV
eukprot:5647073-Prymnesium_polylepis.2